MAERKKYKAINFDLDTNELKCYYNKSVRNAYKEIGNFLKKNGFEHRQWSGYVSKDKMSGMDIVVLNEKMWRKFPWLEQCATRIDITDVGNKFDLISLHKEQIADRQELDYNIREQDEKSPNMNMSNWEKVVRLNNEYSIEQNNISKEKMLDNKEKLMQRE